MGRNYEKAGMLYFIATLFNKGIVFLTVPIFTRILSTSDYGIVTTYNSWVSIATIVLSMALYMAIRTSFVDFKGKTKDFLNTIVTFTCILGVIVFIVTLIIINIIPVSNGYIALLCVIQGFADALIMDYTHYLMMDYKYLKRTVYMMLPNLIAVLVSILAILFVFEQDLYLGRIIPTSCVYFFFSITILAQVFFKRKPCINRKYLKYSMAISLPLIFHGAALTILSQSDRTMITWLADASQTGIYSLVYNFGMIATVITTTLEGIWVPWFMEHMKAESYQDINRRAIDYVHLMAYAMVALLLVGPEILKIMASSKYWEGIMIIPPVVISSFIIFMYSLFVNVEHFYKKTVGITINTVIAAVSNIILNLIFIPYFGYVAAAYTTLASYLICLALHIFRSKKLNKSLFPMRLFVDSLIMIFAVSVIYYFLLDYAVVRWIAMLAFLIVVAIKERNRLTSILKGIVGKKEV